MKTLGQRIKDRRTEMSLSQAALAKTVGMSQQGIVSIETGAVARPKKLPEIAAALGLDLRDLLDPSTASEGRAAESTKRREALGAFRPEITPGSELVGDRTFPIYGSAMGGNGQLIVDAHPIEFVKWPSILEGVRDSYGVRVVGDSMEPAYWQGDMALVHPHLPPERDTDVILFDAPPDGPTEAVIKRLVGYSATEWRLKQYNPPKEWTEYRVDWPVCHRVVGKYARR